VIVRRLCEWNRFSGFPHSGRDIVTLKIGEAVLSAAPQRVFPPILRNPPHAARLLPEERKNGQFPPALINVTFVFDIRLTIL
jgi:hypothetical protein